MKKTAITMLLFAGIIAVLHAAGWMDTRWIPYFGHRLKPALPLPEPKGTITVSVPANGKNLPNTPSTDPRSIIDPSGIMDTFYKALWNTDSKSAGAVTRVLHYGDSPVTADSITADARSLLQERFGDAGHGFVLIAKPWAWYGHRGIGIKAKGWHIAAASAGNRATDHFHGIGGVSFVGSAGVSSTVTLPDDQHTRAQVYYEQQPGGGSFAVTVNDSVVGEVNTAADSPTPGYASFALPPQTSDVTLKVTAGTVRLFGWSFEKDKPGIVYDSLGLNGASVQMALRFFDAGQWAAELQHERPDLVVINYGTNESVFPDYIERYYEKELRSLIERVRESLPHASVLIMSPMDRGERISGGEIITPAVMPRIVGIQKRVAAEMGCAFFNTFEAMGGAGTMAKWYTQQPRMVTADFMHPLPGGARVVGQLLSNAIVEGFEKFKKSHMLARLNGPEL